MPHTWSLNKRRHGENAHAGARLLAGGPARGWRFALTKVRAARLDVPWGICRATSASMNYLDVYRRGVAARLRRWRRRVVAARDRGSFGVRPDVLAGRTARHARVFPPAGILPGCGTGPDVDFRRDGGRDIHPLIAVHRTDGGCALSLPRAAPGARYGRAVDGKSAAWGWIDSVVAPRRIEVATARPRRGEDRGDLEGVGGVRRPGPCTGRIRTRGPSTGQAAGTDWRSPLRAPARLETINLAPPHFNDPASRRSSARDKITARRVRRLCRRPSGSGAWDWKPGAGGVNASAEIDDAGSALADLLRRQRRPPRAAQRRGRSPRRVRVRPQHRLHVAVGQLPARGDRAAGGEGPAGVSPDGRGPMRTRWQSRPRQRRSRRDLRQRNDGAAGAAQPDHVVANRGGLFRRRLPVPPAGADSPAGGFEDRPVRLLDATGSGVRGARFLAARPRSSNCRSTRQRTCARSPSARWPTMLSSV